MKRYDNFVSRILESIEPGDYRAFIAELENLPPDDEGVQVTLKLARAYLARAEEMERWSTSYKAGHQDSGLPGSSPREDSPKGMIVMINRGPDRTEPIEKHRDFIARLESIPPQDINNSVRWALREARIEMAWAEFIQTMESAKKKQKKG